MTSKLFGVVGAVVWGFVSLAGCGGGSGSCSNVQPCGGSVVGTWTIVNTCVSQSGFTPPAACPQVSISETVNEMGTITFNADNTYSEAVSVNATLNEIIPASCLSGLTCSQLNDTIGAATMTDGGTTTSATCSGSASACDCRITISGSNISATGSYVASGNMLTVTPSGGNASTDGYCVQGTMLHVTSTAMTMNMGAMGQMPIASEVVLQRQ